MLPIGAVASAANVTPRVVRYYEQQGLLSSERTSGGQRRYPEATVERVRFLHQLIQAGLTSASIRELLPCVDSRVATASTLRTLEAERDRLRARAAELEAMGNRLDDLIGAARATMDEVAS